jgi:hypothetical protein
MPDSSVPRALTDTEAADRHLPDITGLGRQWVLACHTGTGRNEIVRAWPLNPTPAWQLDELDGLEDQLWDDAVAVDEITAARARLFPVIDAARRRTA